jgi:hypothetical protein
LSLGFALAVRYLLMEGVSPDVTNEDGLTALHQVRLQAMCFLFHLHVFSFAVLH